MIQRHTKSSLFDNQPTRTFSSLQEKTIAKEFNGKQVANSGATKFQKGDVSLDNFLIEAKTKTKLSDSIAIQKGWLEKIEKEALFMGKPYTALAFNFGPDTKNYYVISEELMHILVYEINKKID